MFTEFEYTGRLARAIRFPTGDKALFKYEDGLPVRITTPFGEVIEIARGTGGFIESIEIYHNRVALDGKHERVLFAKYQYQRDGEGRITRYTAADGDVYRMRYQHQKFHENGTEKEIYTAVMQRQRDDVFHGRRDEIRSSGDWISERRWGGGEQSFEQASLERRYRHRLVGLRWRHSCLRTGRSGNGLSYKLDKNGNATTSVFSDGRVVQRQYNAMGKPTAVRSGDRRTVLEYNDFGQLTRRVTPDGVETVWHYDEHSRLIQKIESDGTVTQFVYDDRGFPLRTIIGESVYTFEYDEWGRLKKLVQPRDWVLQWDYDRLGRVMREVRGAASPLLRISRRSSGCHPPRAERQGTR